MIYHLNRVMFASDHWFKTGHRPSVATDSTRPAQWHSRMRKCPSSAERVVGCRDRLKHSRVMGMVETSWDEVIIWEEGTCIETCMIYVYIHTYIHVSIYIYICIIVIIYSIMCVYKYIYIDKWYYTYVYIYIYVYIHVWCIHIYTLIHMHAYL